ncbi:MAG: DUF2857 domain-containing protein [Burkholderiaceae bacterium]|nr:DUF2857 domain-containing protein [Burkholderiaceae bacterium]
MLALQDAQVRLVLLNHVTVRLADAAHEELDAAGIERELLGRLRQLSAVDLSRLAAMRSLTIGVAFDGAALKAGLRAVALVNEAKALETYFIRNGASTHLMSALFKVRRKLTLARRRDCGAWRPAGRLRLPDYTTRERIYQAWRAITDPAPRIRYYRLHQEFARLPIAVLEAVVREFEADE